MPPNGQGLNIGFIEPHLHRFGGIRRMVEFANRLTDRGHTVVFYLPEVQDLRCSWMECRAAIKTARSGFDDALDVVLFNHEPQWHLVDRFRHARRSAFYALHYGRLYDKEACWEAVRAPVDLVLANSNWTADQIKVETGYRPTVVLGGVNRDVFRPYGGTKRYPLLCSGDDRRHWKGTDTITAAARTLGLPLEGYAAKGLDQPALGREYDAAEVFAVGSWFEGFCQPGLEAMACGVPLVTTDNGGCREYATDGETGLVVRPRDPSAMAKAIAQLRADDDLARRLAANGLDLVAEKFDWEQRTDEFEELLDGLSAGQLVAPPPPRPQPPDDPELSVVALQWNGLRDTQHFVESVRRGTDVPYELILVDNGSEWEAANYVGAAADQAVLNDENLGFAAGMNQGLARARGRYVAFCNNDTVLPPGWASTLLETARADPGTGVVVPALTAARNQRTVRSEPGTTVQVLPPFSAPPSAVLYLMPADLVRSLGGWGEEYEIASGEDVDLAFKVWVNDRDIVFDERVLVGHIGKGAASRLDDWRKVWAENRRRFLDKWTGDAEVPRLDSCDPARFERNRATARAAAQWMDRFFTERDRVSPPRRAVRVRSLLRRAVRRSMPVWRRARPFVPIRLADPFRRRLKAGIDPPSAGTRLPRPGVHGRTGTEPREGAPAPASGWYEQMLAAQEGPAPYLVRRSDGTVYVVEGGLRRRVKSGLLAAALQAALGSPRRLADVDLERMGEGPPVEVFAGPSGPLFVVVGGRRHPLDGMPVPSPMGVDLFGRLPDGEPFDVARANVPRAEATRPPPSLGRRVLRRARRELARRR